MDADLPKPQNPRPFLPSLRAAMLAGAIGMPLCIVGGRALDTDILRSFWMLLTFYFPVYFTCIDYREVQHATLQSVLEPKLLHGLAWRRGLAWLFSALASSFLLKALLMRFMAG